MLNDARILPFHEIANANSLPAGAPVAIFGNPNRNLTMSPALWSNRVAYGQRSAFPLSSQYVILGEALPGHSGGAALTLDGRLLGMVKATTPAASDKDTGMTMLVPYKHILERARESF